jgi:hypothetical protein
MDTIRLPLNANGVPKPLFSLRLIWTAAIRCG